MEFGFIIFKQILVMFSLMCIGYVFYKKKLISDQGSKDIGKILLYLVIPVVIVKSFLIPNTVENNTMLIHSLWMSIACMGISMIVSHFCFGKKEGVANFSATFSNAGFIGIPLVTAILGEGSVFYISIMIVLINALQWTYGVYIMTDDSRVMHISKILTNPIVISVGIGFIVYLSQLSLPQTAIQICGLISGLNTPLAMIVSGVYLAQSDFGQMLKNRQNYRVALVRLILIPLVLILIFYLVPFGHVPLKLAILIAGACPVGSNVAIFAHQYDKDYHQAVQQVCLTTILCLFSLPVMISVASYLIH